LIGDSIISRAKRTRRTEHVVPHQAGNYPKCPVVELVQRLPTVASPVPQRSATVGATYSASVDRLALDDRTPGSQPGRVIRRRADEICP
jgi:hypothetical protein